jgi:hypothetical protein
MSAERALSDRISNARKLCQSCLSKLALSTGIASSESFLLFNDRIWGIRFSMGDFCARWQLDANEILVYESGKLLDRIVLLETENRQVA